MSITSVTSASALAGNPLPLTVYDGNDNPEPQANVTWSQNSGAALPASLTVAADPAIPGRFNFVSTLTGSWIVRATVGAASVSITLNFLGLKITSP